MMGVLDMGKMLSQQGNIRCAPWIALLAPDPLHGWFSGQIWDSYHGRPGWGRQSG